MMTHFDIARAERALAEVKGPETESAVVAMMKDNGQIVIYNLGESAGRVEIYETMGRSVSATLAEFRARLEMKREKGSEKDEVAS